MYQACAFEPCMDLYCEALARGQAGTQVCVGRPHTPNARMRTRTHACTHTHSHVTGAPALGRAAAFSAAASLAAAASASSMDCKRQRGPQL